MAIIQKLLYPLMFLLARIGDAVIFIVQIVVAGILFGVMSILVVLRLLEKFIETQFEYAARLKNQQDRISQIKRFQTLSTPTLSTTVHIRAYHAIQHFYHTALRVTKKFSTHISKQTPKMVKQTQIIGKNITTQTSTVGRIVEQLGKTLSALVIPAKKVHHKKRGTISYKIGKSVKSEWKGFIIGILLSIFFILVPYNAYLFVKALPNPHLLSERQTPATTQIFDRDGRLLYEIFSDQNRKPMPLTEIPSDVVNATIAIEDKDFYKHNGISIKGIIRALRENTVSDQTQGGSTITQQLIKNTLLTSEVTLSRKVREALLAFWTEQLYSKNQILEMYLNQVPYGGTAWGVAAASDTYFGKRVEDLSLAEAALLAGLPAAPTLYSPHGAYPEYAKERQEEVLRRMVEDGYITSDEAETAKSETLTFRPPTTNIKAPHFVMYVKQLLVEKYGQRLVEQGGLRVTTTLDLEVQEKIEEIVARQVSGLRSLLVGNGAALVTNPQDGEILAMVGSKDYFNNTDDGNVNVTTALRQPGSSIKMVNYVAALENGFTAASLLKDTPVVFQIPGTENYAPKNYDGKYHGIVPLRTSFASSYNITAVRVLNQIGVSTMVDMGKRMGIDTWNDESRFGLSLTLGGGEVKMTDMAEVFGTIANGGVRTDLNPIISVTDFEGKTYENRTVRKIRAISEEISYIISDILSDNTARTPAFGPSSLLVIPGKTVSVKTGTTDQIRDNWTIGFTPSVVVSVWVGNNDNSPLHPQLTSGVTGAAPIWNEIMQYMLKDKADEKPIKPNGIVELPCYGRVEYFVKGTEPVGGCQPIPKPSPSTSPTPNP